MVTLAALVSVPANVGYPPLALLVGAESAGALVPGETALRLRQVPMRPEVVRAAMARAGVN